MDERFPILRFFEYEHLPPRLQVVSEPFHEVAHAAASAFPHHAERHQLAEFAAGLRKLLESKDCIVRAMLS